MSKFLSDLKKYFMEELRNKYDFEIDDVITFYEAINQNKNESEIKKMIDDCSNYNYKFNYINKYKESDGYIKGHILIELNTKLYNYTIVLNNYPQRINIIKSSTICSYEANKSVEDYERQWEKELKEFSINEIKTTIIKKEEYIMRITKEIEYLKKELIELEK